MAKRQKSKHDLFISYASEDKSAIDLLMKSLVRIGILAIWIDEIYLQPAQSIRKTIDVGIAESRYMVPFLSSNYFKKHWTGKEFNAAFALEKQIIPIWHEVGASEVRKFSPMLADIKAVNWQLGPDSIAELIANVLEANQYTVFAKMAASREEKRAFWSLVACYVYHHLGQNMDELLAPARNSLITNEQDPDLWTHCEKEIGITPEKVRMLRESWNYLDTDDAVIAIVEVFKEGEREHWVPPTNGRDRVLAKIREHSQPSKE